VGLQRLYRPHVEDIAFLFLRRALPLPWSLPRAYIRRLPSTTFARWRRRFLSDTDPPLADCYLANEQMRLVRFTRTRSVTRPICGRDLDPPQSRIDHRGFFISIRSIFIGPHVFLSSACRHKYRSCLRKRGKSGMIHSAGIETCDFVGPVQIRDYLRQDSIYRRLIVSYPLRRTMFQRFKSVCIVEKDVCRCSKTCRYGYRFLVVINGL